VKTCKGWKSKAGAGTYDFHEAVDYTPSGLPPGETERHDPILPAHHQG